MENTTIRENTDIELLIGLYKDQMHKEDYNCRGYEEHHQNGPMHYNSPGTGWEQSHNNSYFGR